MIRATSATPFSTEHVTPSVIEVRDLTVAYNESPVLWDVDLDVQLFSNLSLEAVDRMLIGPQETSRHVELALLGITGPHGR